MQCLFELCTPQTHSAPDSERDKQTKNKHPIFAPTVGARCTIFPKLCKVIEHVEIIKKVPVNFLIQRVVFLTGCTEKNRLK